jgi:SAM-dependent methyltransferase
MKNNIYTSGKYLANNPSWNSGDSPWKANNIMLMTKKNKIKFSSVCEVGCGSGEILKCLKKNLPPKIKFEGYDISPQAYKICTQNPSEVKFFLGDFTKRDKKYDLLLIIDVLEHTESAEKFLAKLKGRAKNYIFHVPLDINLQNTILEQNLIKSREKVGHLHFYSKKLIFEVLRSSGFEIKDSFITPSFTLYRPKSVKNFLGFIVRKILILLNKEFASRVCNGFSIMIYCQ